MNIKELLTTLALMITILLMVLLFNYEYTEIQYDTSSQLGVMYLNIDYIPENIEYCSQVVLWGAKNSLNQDCSYIINN